MIEKLSCCIAHPVTALRAIKDKLNELITSHNKLSISGGSGGTAGSVVLDFNTQWNEDFTEASASCALSYDEIGDLIENNVIPVARVECPTEIPSVYSVPYVAFTNGMYLFSAYVGGDSIIVGVMPEMMFVNVVK